MESEAGDNEDYPRIDPDQKSEAGPNASDAKNRAGERIQPETSGQKGGGAKAGDRAWTETRAEPEPVTDSKTPTDSAALVEPGPAADSEDDSEIDPDAELSAKADLGKRIVAGAIDAAIAIVVSFIPGIGGLLAIAYWLVRDGFDFEFMDQRSVGKKLTELRPLREDGLPMDLETSIKRNWMFAISGLAPILFMIPFLGLLLVPLLIIASIAIAAIEIFLVVVDPDGRRFGDKYAGTRVIEVGEEAGELEEVAPSTPPAGSE